MDETGKSEVKAIGIRVTDSFKFIVVENHLFQENKVVYYVLFVSGGHRDREQGEWLKRRKQKKKGEMRERERVRGR